MHLSGQIIFPESIFCNN